MARLNMLSPWMIFYHEMVAFFSEDPEVNIVWDDSGDTYKIKVFVNNPAKGDALLELLPHEKTFGVITVEIEVTPANYTYFYTSNNKRNDIPSLFLIALNNNRALSFIKTVEGIYSNPITYIVFKKEVVQYYNDDLGDFYGQCSTLYQELAKNIFGSYEGIFYCTEKISYCITSKNAASLNVTSI